MLTLEIVVVLVSSAVVTIFAVWFFGVIKLLMPSISVDFLTQLGAMSEEELIKWGKDLLTNTPGLMKYLMDSVGTVMIGGFLAIVLSILVIWLSVLQYMAYYDVFRSSDPRNATMYLVLSIVLSMIGGGFVLALFVFINREKDLGMPPRRDEQISAVPVWTPPVEPQE